MSMNTELYSVADNVEFRPTATISNGGQNSTVVDLTGRGPRLIAIRFPSTYVGGNITLEVSDDQATWSPVAALDGTNLAYTQSAGKTIVDTNGSSMAAGAWPFLRLVSATPVTGDQTLTVVLLR